MSAKVQDSLDGLAPKMREAVESALAECNAKGLDAVVYESVRSNELQRIYFARGRRQKDDGTWEIVDPGSVVTRASSAEYGWHLYGLAVDVISKRHRWDVTRAWREAVTAIFKKHGLDAGGDWSHPDFPHYQWGKCRATPSDVSRRLLHEQGVEAVWKAVGAA